MRLWAAEGQIKKCVCVCECVCVCVSESHHMGESTNLKYSGIRWCSSAGDRTMK